MNQSLFIFFVLLATCASIGSALQCYECSPLDPSQFQICGDPFGLSSATRIRMCSSGEVCIKQGTPKVTIEGQDIPPIVVRGCAPQSICQNEPSEYQEFCHACSNDLCNSAVTIIPSISISIVLYVIKLMFL